MSAKILLVDYDPCSICKIRGILSTVGLLTIVARDGVEGVEAFERYRPDLALVQDLIPRKHGFEVCKELKRTEHGSVTPVVLIAHVKTGRRYAILATGCDDYVEKPVDGQVLLQKVLRLLPALAPDSSADEVAAPLRAESAEREEVRRAVGAASPAPPRRRRRPRRRISV